MKPFIIFIVIVIVSVGLYLFFTNQTVFDFKNNPVGAESEKNNSGDEGNASPITGESCDNFNKRPFAVMLAGDPRTRPISGISEADLVVEMPVYRNSIYRYMALFGCEEPESIGSVRSSRHDFLPLAKGFDAIYAHWGGSHFALDLLKEGTLDNIDALKNPFDTFYRKTTIPAPDNGFTSYGRLLESSNRLNYSADTKFEGYSHLAGDETESKINENMELIINYPGEYKVLYLYNPRTNEYLRYKGGTPEVDKNNNKQVGVKNVIIMFAWSEQLDADYNDVDIEGEGSAVIFRNGEKIKATWKKDKDNMASKLYFLDDEGNEIKFVPGKIWIEVADPSIEISWKKI